MNYCKKIYYGSGEIQSETWYHNNKLHCDDGPARVAYLPSGKFQSIEWYQYGQLHRKCGPARIFYYLSDGRLSFKEWYLNGKLHRTDGPAEIYYNEFGGIKSEYWHLNDKDIYPKQWLEENGYEWPLTEQEQTEMILTIA